MQGGRAPREWRPAAWKFYILDFQPRLEPGLQNERLERRQTNFLLQFFVLTPLYLLHNDRLLRSMGMELGNRSMGIGRTRSLRKPAQVTCRNHHHTGAET